MTWVNSEEVTLPVNSYPGVDISEHEDQTLVTSDYGVKVFWNNVYNVRVVVGGRYLNRTSGLCGYYSEMKYDDFWTSYGTIATDPVEFGNSWKGDPTCENATTVDHPCDANLERRLIARENCSTLLKPPFSNCSSYINATEEGYIADCEYDMCACEDDPVVCYCQALEAYADDCSPHVDIKWKELNESAICRTPCASAPCYNGGSCTNLGYSAFECKCPVGYLGERCEIKDRCQIPYLYFSTSVGTRMYNIENTSNIPTIVDDRVNALLSFDAINKRLYLYIQSEGLTSFYLDGSNSTTTLVTGVEFFTVDGRNNLVYYYYTITKKIKTINMTTGEEGDVDDALSSLTSIKDLEMDMTNGYLYIARANDPPIVRFNPADKSILEFNFDGSAQSISVDEYNNVIYWANYDGINHNVMKTMLNKQTVALNISYPDVIDLTSDMLHLHVLDTSNKRIDKYLKTSLEKQGNMTYEYTIYDLVVAYDSDECCLDAAAACPAKFSCINTLGNFVCVCSEGYVKNGSDCEATPCLSNPCLNGGICTDVGDSFECECPSEYRSDRCEIEVEATCVTFGDPHYKTFDGKRFDFMGKCEYVLAKDRVNNTFEIRQENEPCGNGLVTCTKSITVIFRGLIIKLQRGVTNVNGGDISSSTNYGAVNITIHSNGRTVVTSDYGVTVFWNNVYNVRVIIGGHYVNRTSGLCGYYNEIKYDHFWTSYGTIVTDPVEFGNSWKVDPTCENATTVDHPCDANPERRLIARENCSALLKPPFSNCSSYINATEEGYISDCEYDMCACEDDPVVCYCQALEAYADYCSSKVEIDWMNLDEFAICGTPCASTPCYNGGSCTNVGNSFECRCPAGFLGVRCEMEDVNKCEYVSCGFNANCSNANGSYLCECQTGYEGNGTNCTDIDECLKGRCGFNANCKNTDGSFFCECQIGYEGNGTNCKTKISSNQPVSPGSNIGTGVIVGIVVAAVVVLVAGVFIVVCCFHRRKPQVEKTEDIHNIKNVAYEPDTEAGNNPDSSSQFEEPKYAELNLSKMDPIDANYQSLIAKGRYAADHETVANPNPKFEEPGYTELDNSKRDRIGEDYQSLVTEGYEPLHKSPYEDVKAYASLNQNSNPGNEASNDSVYEELP
ncbi:uncharacterized protein LOC114528955 [Dendronephthya gigantea]|uniref:uncharacterized protein LOC114528955 n=1 Tax=Dendronephthya gigantea TaxID=151771 RepID=UPI0010695812|nr:uncharacterized protein LOC114528955 [Dendronephthya gigantea]